MKQKLFEKYNLTPRSIQEHDNVPTFQVDI